MLDSASIQQLKTLDEQKDQILSAAAKKIRAITLYENMNPIDREICIRDIVGQSCTQWDLRRELTGLGIEYFDVNWADVGSTDETAVKTWLLPKIFGRLVSKNGAFVKVTTIEKIY